VTKPKHNLPAQATPFVGRTTELADLAARLTDPACRLLTLIGPGGIGKTRLALEAAARALDHFPDGVYYVPLQAVSAPDLIPVEIAAALQLRLQGSDPRGRLLESLADRALLLVLDSFEHLLDGVDLVTDILAAAPQVTIMVTSREALNVQHEWLWPVPGMRHPTREMVNDGRVPALETYSAVQLFVQHALRNRPDFSLADEARGVARICALVEGMPLALELAASWARVLTCDEIADEIERGLDILDTRARDVPQRHRNMRAVLDHSWALLSAAEQQVFMRLSVFRGGFTREAAAAIAGASLPALSTLVDKSLLRHDAGGRYDIHELIRQYAEQRLSADPDDHERTSSAHAAYYLDLVASRWDDLIGARPKEALGIIEEEFDNVRAAWGWAIAARLEDAIDRVLDSLWFFYDTRGWYREGERSFDQAVSALTVSHPDEHNALLISRLMSARGHLLNSLSRCEEALDLLDRALTIARQLEEPRAIGLDLFRQGEVYAFESQFTQAEACFREALPILQSVGEQWLVAYTLTWIANVIDDPAESAHLRQQSYDLFRAIKCEWGVAIATVFLAYVKLDENDNPGALRLAQAGLERCQNIGIHWAVSMALWTLGTVAYRMQRYQSAIWCLGEGIYVALEHHLAHMVNEGAMMLGLTLRAMNEHARAKEFFALTYYYADRHVGPAYSLEEVEQHLSPAEKAAIIARSRQITDPVATVRAALRDLEALEAENHGGSAEAESDLETATPPAGPQLTAPASPAAGTVVPLRRPALIDPLTERERDVLRLVAQGYSNREIAEELVLARGTVKWYVSQIFSKLGVTNRTQAAARARELDLLA